MRSTSTSTAVSTCGMSTGSCFWKTHAFMQSLQMRCPVPGHIGLSSAMSASAARLSPTARISCISPIFSSSGQPASGTPSGLCLIAAVFASTRPLAHESLSRSWQSRQ